MKRDEAVLISDQLDPLAANLTKRLETLSAATVATVHADAIVLSRRLLSALLHVRLVADRVLAMHEQDAYEDLDDLLPVLGSNLDAFRDRAEDILAGVSTAKQAQSYIETLGQATTLHKAIDALIGGPMQTSGQDLMAAAATARYLSGLTRDQSTDMARQQLARALVLQLSFGAVGLLVAAGAAWGIGRRISGGIRRLTATMGALAGGDLAVEPPFLHRGGEFGAMGRALGVFRDNMVEGERLGRERDRADRDRRIQNMRFGAALSHMSEALCMFDAKNQLVVGNDRLAGMLGMPAASIPTGVTIEEIQGILTGLAIPRKPDMETLLRAISQLSIGGQRAAYVQELADGRTLSVNFAPMEEDGWLVTLEDITAHRLVEARIAHMAHHDALTGLANRVLFLDRLGEAVARGGRGERSALLCLDLDHFKAVNDTLGHPVGDALLRAVTRRLLDNVRETDTVARLGGDEFAVLQTNVARSSDSAALGKRLIEAISAPYDLDGNQVIIGTSIGIALVPGDGESQDGLMKAADMALYRSKGDGRGRYCFFEPAMDVRVRARRSLEMDLRKALADGELQMFYQPQINIASGQVCGVEALLRWEHPDRGTIAPTEFIPLAEETGLIVPIGKWILQRTCADAAMLPEDLKVAVNLSPLQFKSRTLVEDLTAAMAAAGLPAGRLELEITETAMLDDTDRVLAILHRFRDLGVSVALDDFGTGYSSLSYLRRFPFDKVKIDRSFIAGLGKVEECDIIVAALIDLCTRLGMTTTSEGVETESQLEILTELRCTEGQGYLFSRPRSRDEVAGLCATPESSWKR